MPLNIFTGSLLNSHSISMGKSPDEIKQLTDTESSKFEGVSPKLKATILGGAKQS